MTPQVPPHEVLLFIDTHLTTPECFENKDDNPRPFSAKINAPPICWSALLLQLLSLLRHAWKGECEHAWEIIRARHFIEVKLGDVNNQIEYTTSINPYLFSLAANLN